jgi:hypothetical protein
MAEGPYLLGIFDPDEWWFSLVGRRVGTGGGSWVSSA